MRELLHDTWSTFSRRGGTLLGGALAFYAMLSVAPLLVIAMYVAGLVTSESLARTALLENLSQYVGAGGAQTIGGLMERVMRPGAGWRGVLAGMVVIYASTRLFNELEAALDHLWSLPEPETKSFLKRLGEKLVRRTLKFGLVLATGVVLVLLVVLKLGYDAASAKLGFVTPMGWRVVQASVSVLICTVLFALLFRHITPARFPMRQALLGGGITAALFSAGAWAISAYLSHASLAATYGDAASIVVLLLWVHYSAQIFLLGAAFTGEWVKRHGGFTVDSKRST